MLNRSRIVEAARTQLGVPYHKDALLPGVGLDCVGLLVYAYTSAGIVLPPVDFKQKVLSIGPNVIPQKLEQAGFVITDTPLIGDIIVWDYQGEPAHTGLVTELTEPLRVIQSCNCFSKVVEHDLLGQWIHRFRNFYTIPNNDL